MKFRRPKSQTIMREGHIIFHITKKPEHAFILDLEMIKQQRWREKTNNPQGNETRKSPSLLKAIKGLY